MIHEENPVVPARMKARMLTNPVNLSLLTEELFSAFPEWRYPNPLDLETMLTDVVITAERVTFPESTDEKEVQKVIDKHDKDQDSKNQKKAKEHTAAFENAKTKLRDLGLTDKEIEALQGVKTGK